MGSVNITKSLVAVGVGGVDIALGKLDESQGKSGLTSYQNMGRIAMVGGGILAELMFSKYASIGEVAHYAATPLLMQTIMAEVPALSGSASTPAKATKDFVARRTANWIRNEGAAGGGYRQST